MNPIELFQEWWAEAVRSSGLRYPSACCLSTLVDGATVDARVVDLKEVEGGSFVFGTHMESPKAKAIEANPAVALTFWWDALARQVRVRGIAVRAPDTTADRLFANRSIEARCVSLLSSQSEVLQDPDALRHTVEAAVEDGAELHRPMSWGAYSVRPERIEFLRFCESRMHERMLYVKSRDGWTVSRLAP